MKHAILFVVLVCCIGCGRDAEGIDYLSFDYPHGETRLSIWADGRASLAYGALPQQEVIRPGIFDAERVFAHLQPHLHPNAPREDRPDPSAERGMVQVYYADGREQAWLIFNAADLVAPFFAKARANLIETMP